MKKSQASKLPKFFKPLFWSYNFSLIDTKKDKQRVIINTINYGKWKHWKWIIEYYGQGEVKRVIENTPMSEFRARALKLISILLGIKKMKYASRSIKLQKEKNLSRVEKIS